MMWLTATVLGTLWFLAFTSQRWRGQHLDPGRMSQQWLAEYRGVTR